MSDELPIKLTLKGGSEYDAPWITVDAANPEELQMKATALAGSGAIQAAVELANLFKAANHAAPLLDNHGLAAPDPSPWSTPAQQPVVQQQPQAQPQQQNRYGGTPHPESKACHCGKVLELKKTSTGKSKWQCPDWRWNNGNPNNHAMEWAN